MPVKFVFVMILFVWYNWSVPPRAGHIPCASGNIAYTSKGNLFSNFAVKISDRLVLSNCIYYLVKFVTTRGWPRHFQYTLLRLGQNIVPFHLSMDGVIVKSTWLTYSWRGLVLLSVNLLLFCIHINLPICILNWYFPR